MDLTNTWDPRVSHFFCRVLSLFWHRASDDNLLDFLRSVLGPNTLMVRHLAVIHRPSYLEVHSDAGFLLFIGGCANARQAINLCWSYQDPPSQRPDLGTNRWVAARGAEIVPSLNQQEFLQAGRKYFVGYSAGGAIATAMAGVALGLAPNLIISVVTFGSPRAADARMRPSFADSTVVRWMNEGDPIPFLPPRSWERPDRINSLFGNGSQIPNPFVHFGFGRVLMIDDTIEDRDLPRVSTVPGTGTALGWATGILTDPVVEHQIATYEARLRNQAEILRAANPPVAPQPTPPGVPRVEVQAPGVIFPPLDFDIIRYAQPQSVPDPGFTPQEVPIINNQGEGLPSPLLGKVYYYQRRAKRYYVFWAGFPLFQVRGRREARRRASQLNQTLAAFNRAPYKDEWATEESVQVEFNK